MLVSVALPLPLFRNFTYEVDDADTERARPGMRAVVPFRNRREIGIVVGDAELPAGIEPKRVFSLPDSRPPRADSRLS